VKNIKIEPRLRSYHKNDTLFWDTVYVSKIVTYMSFLGYSVVILSEGIMSCLCLSVAPTDRWTCCL